MNKCKISFTSIITLLCAFLAALAFFSGALAVEKKAPPKKAGVRIYTPEQVQRKVRDLESLNLLKALNLNDDQMMKLLPLLYDSRLLEQEVFEGYQKDGEKAMKMMDMLTEKLYKDEGIDVPTEEAVWFALGTLYEYEYDRYTTMALLVKKTRKILNRNQLRVISEYMPCIIPWSTVNAPDRIGQSGAITKLEKMLDDMRGKQGEAYKKAKRSFLVELDWRLRIDRHEDDMTRQILVRQIDEKLDEIHKLSDNEYEIRKKDLAQSVRPPDLEIMPPRVGEELDEYITEYILNPSNIGCLVHKLESRGIKDYPKPDDVIDQDIDKKTDDHEEDKDIDLD